MTSFYNVKAQYFFFFWFLRENGMQCNQLQLKFISPRLLIYFSTPKRIFTKDSNIYMNYNDNLYQQYPCITQFWKSLSSMISVHCPIVEASFFLRLRTSIPFEANWSFSFPAASSKFLFMRSDSFIASMYLLRNASSFACVPRSLIRSFAFSLLLSTSSCSSTYCIRCMRIILFQ